MFKELNAYKVRSESDPHKWYQVVLERWGRGYKAKCSCPDYIYRRRRCKHIREALEAASYGL